MEDGGVKGGTGRPEMYENPPLVSGRVMDAPRGERTSRQMCCKMGALQGRSHQVLHRVLVHLVPL